jgi:hypothetical protein
MPAEVSIADLVRQLRRVGLRPSERLAATITEQGDEALAPLLELASDTALLHEDEPGCYGPVHALRLLGELPTPALAEPLLGLLPVTRRDSEDRATTIWANEVPQIIARAGAEVQPLLQQIITDEARDILPRAVATQALAYTAISAPETQPEVGAWLRARLADVANPTLAAHVVAALANMGVAEAYGEVMAAYREGRVDRDVIAPAEARQLLLGKLEKRLGCVAHPLWERYDEHGPFTKEEYAMADRYARDDEDY